MQFVGKMLTSVSEFYKDINPSTLSGAIDIVVIKHINRENDRNAIIDTIKKDDNQTIDIDNQKNELFVCSPFHVRFGKIHVLRPQDKLVEISINSVKIENLAMKVGEAGEAFFVVPIDPEDEVNSNWITSPLPLPTASPEKEPSELDLKKSSNSSFNSNLSTLSPSPPLISSSMQHSQQEESGIPISSQALSDSEISSSINNPIPSSITKSSQRPKSPEWKWEWGGLPEKKRQVKISLFEYLTDNIANNSIILKEPSKILIIPENVDPNMLVDETTDLDNLFKECNFDEFTKTCLEKLYIQFTTIDNKSVILPGIAAIQNVISLQFFNKPIEKKLANEERQERQQEPGQEKDLNIEKEKLEKSNSSIPTASIPIPTPTPPSSWRQLFGFSSGSKKEIPSSSSPTGINLPPLVSSLSTPSLVPSTPSTFNLSSSTATLPINSTFNSNANDGTSGNDNSMNVNISANDGENNNSPSKINPISNNLSFTDTSSLNLASHPLAPPFTSSSPLSVTVPNSVSNFALNSSPETLSPPFPSIEKKSVGIRGGKKYIKSLRLSSDELEKLPLKEGMNTITFTLSGSKGTIVQSRIFLWSQDSKVVISDIDGTITKSDALGHLFTFVGKDWTHIGVARLFTDISRNGYKFLYLTSRAIGQANATRGYLRGIEQNKFQLPEGPVIMSPERFFAAVKRELIEGTPEHFKIPCLQDIRNLFKSPWNGESVDSLNSLRSHPNSHFSTFSHFPFYAGFGNKTTDARSYRAVGVPPTRIFTINSSGDVNLELLSSYTSSYVRLTDLVDQMFPPLLTQSILSSLLTESMIKEKEWELERENENLKEEMEKNKDKQGRINEMLSKKIFHNDKEDSSFNDFFYWKRNNSLGMMNLLPSFSSTSTSTSTSHNLISSKKKKKFLTEEANLGKRGIKEKVANEKLSMMKKETRLDRKELGKEQEGGIYNGKRKEKKKMMEDDKDEKERDNWNMENQENGESLSLFVPHSKEDMIEYSSSVSDAMDKMGLEDDEGDDFIDEYDEEETFSSSSPSPLSANTNEEEEITTTDNSSNENIIRKTFI